MFQTYILYVFYIQAVCIRKSLRNLHISFPKLRSFRILGILIRILRTLPQKKFYKIAGGAFGPEVCLRL